MSQEHDGMTVREMAVALGVRLGTAYGLLWDGIVAGQKSESGEWVVDRVSVAAYEAQRSARRARIPRSQSKSAIQRSVIDVEAAAHA